MARNENKRQKRLAKKKRKQQKKKETQLIPGSPAYLRRMADLSVKAPVHQCWVSQQIFEQGMGGVLLCRKMSGGDIAFSHFLLDTFCLGVKDCTFAIMSPGVLQARLEKIHEGDPMRKAEPEYARKLVEDCVEWSRNVGFTPHKDYELAKRIFGDIDPTECDETFEFGKEGKPFYMNGPHDSPSRVQQIMDTLRRNCGDGGFHYTLGGSALPPDIQRALEQADFDVVEDEEE